MRTLGVCQGVSAAVVDAVLYNSLGIGQAAGPDAAIGPHKLINHQNQHPLVVALDDPTHGAGNLAGLRLGGLVVRYDAREFRQPRKAVAFAADTLNLGAGNADDRRLEHVD